MGAPIALACAAILTLYLLGNIYRLTQKIAKAKASGLPYIVLPVHVYDTFWLASYWIWASLLDRVLPAKWKGIRYLLLNPEWTYLHGHRPFAEIGSDIFLTVSPKRITVFVADADVITQITTRRNDFPKPLHMYTRLDIYGKNVVTTEGNHWRTHRKVTNPSFSEKNNELVFYETLHHAKSMLRLWTGPNGRGDLTVKEPGADAMRFALYVISRAGFDVRVLWPHEDSKSSNLTNDSDSTLFGAKPPPGHKMAYRDALGTLLGNIILTQVLPPHLLVKAPFRAMREVGTAVDEWGKYMNELYEIKKKEVASGCSTEEGMDLFGALIRESGILEEPANKEQTLQKSDILGNAFIIMLAGHETTANVLHFSLILLAMNCASQRRLQEDIDRTLQGKPVEKWTYEEEIPRLWNGMAAAVMNETLRVIPPIITIPKSTAARPQTVTIGDNQHTIPGDCNVMLSSAVHRNPRYWPHTDATDLNRFRPERWLLDPADTSTSPIQRTTSSLEARGEIMEEATSTHLFKPAKGSFIPFSDGYRSCIGRRFAQVELLAVFAVIFRDYSVELAVDEYATDAEIAAMPKGGEERRRVWQKAADRADYLMTKTMTSIITSQMRGTDVPLRFVRRGEERFM